MTSGPGADLASPHAPRDRSAPGDRSDPELRLTGAQRTLLHWLREQPEPCTVNQIAAATSRHTNSVRAHLDVLVARRLAASWVAAPNGGRGRPAILYAAAPPPVAPVELIGPLTRALADLPDGGDRAYAAGASWARDLGGAGHPELLDDMLLRLGCEPEHADGVIRLHACPWLEAARAHPTVVCALHRGLIAAVVGDRADVRLTPLTPAGTCDLVIDPPPTSAIA